MITACKFGICVLSTLEHCMTFKMLVKSYLYFFLFRHMQYDVVSSICHNVILFFCQLISLVMILVVLRNTSPLDVFNRHNKNGICTFEFVFLRRKGIRLLKSMRNCLQIRVTQKNSKENSCFKLSFSSISINSLQTSLISTQILFNTIHVYSIENNLIKGTHCE